MSSLTSAQVPDVQVSIAPDAIVVTHALLRGKITVGSSTIVHPRARIDAGDGEIIIGAHNIIEETSVIENVGPPGSVLIIGNDNLFEVGAICHATKVGDNNVFGIKSYVGPGVEITSGCMVGAKCRVLMRGTVSPQTVVFFEQNLCKTAKEKPSNQRTQTEFLKKLIPKYSLILQNKKE